MMFMIVLMVLSLAQAEQPSTFDVVYEQTEKCLEDASFSIERRKLCYSTCKNAASTIEHRRICSRLKKSTEEEYLVDHFIESGDETAGHKAVKDANATCSDFAKGLSAFAGLLSRSSKDEDDANDLSECLGDIYITKQEVLLKEGLPKEEAVTQATQK